MTLAARAALWIPPVAMMGLIFFLSAQPDLSTGEGPLHLVVRKIGHATVFGVLCLLWWRALRTSTRAERAGVAALAVTIAYAGVDEYHQSFVAGRHASGLDVVIDSFGAAVTALLVSRRAGNRPVGPRASRAR